VRLSCNFDCSEYGKESSEMRAHLDIETRLCSTEHDEFTRCWIAGRIANIKVDVKEMKVEIISRQRPLYFTLCKSMSYYLSVVGSLRDLVPEVFSPRFSHGCASRRKEGEKSRPSEFRFD
jgi:hypothetical protein